MRWMKQVICMEKMKSAYKILVRIPERRRAFGRHSHRLKGNINIDLKI
jgi:hypothetical protein